MLAGINAIIVVVVIIIIIINRKHSFPPVLATAHVQARPASPPKSDSGAEDFSSMPSFSIDLISWPVV
ncbi:hypothetical protein KC349_g43 [Hortaea werneckii]|nr:hypothetical protein KC349_g43 [Hortaea werneckii]